MKPTLKIVSACSRSSRDFSRNAAACGFTARRLLADFVHQRHARVVIDFRAVGHGVNELAGFIQKSGAEIGKPVQLGDTVGHVPKEHGNVIIGIRLCIAARAGAEQHHARHAVAVDLIQGDANRSRIGSIGALLAICCI